MSKLEKLLENNKTWAQQISAERPEFFQKLSEVQNPEYLWIGCSDSRISPVESTGLLPGDLFVHRNIANLVAHNDLNCLSVLQFAVEFLQVKHIIVCGHYGCGGVTAALQNERLGLIDNWLRQIQEIAKSHKELLEAAPDDEKRIDLLCELNVVEQVLNVAETTVLQDAWARGQKVSVHGWIYRLDEGIYQDLNVTIENLADLSALRENSLLKYRQVGAME